MSEKQKYFLTQKLVGIGMILLGVLLTIIVKGAFVVALIVVPIGIDMLISKKTLLTNKYFFEVGE